MIFKKYKKQLIISSLVILLPMLIGLLLWDTLPESFAAHWGIDGQPDGWVGKAVGVFVMPLFLLVLNYLCIWITELDNRKRNQNRKVMNLVFWCLPLISVLSGGLIYATAMGKTWDVSILMPIALGLLFVCIGNYLPKCKQNNTIGIKVIWALNNEENWNATHRFSGKLWVVSGLITVFSALLPTRIGFPIMFISLIGAGAVSTLYSYLYYRRQLKCGTAVPTAEIPVDKPTKALRWIVLVLVTAILVSTGFLMFSGRIDFTFTEEALVMDATYYSPLTLSYEKIDSIEYREGNVPGTRTGGYGSFRLLLGFFENEEFGTYYRYTYYQPESCIVLTSGTKTLVLSGEDAEQTLEIYRMLMEKMGG